MFIVKLRFLIPKGFAALTIFPFIFVKTDEIKNNKVIINHEKIHIRQQIELLFVLFFLWYFIEFILLYMRYRDRYKAYRNIVFEKEAYCNEKGFVYLDKRTTFSFLTYYFYKK